jgi:hypothetical protein
MRSPDRILQQDDARVVVAAVVERPLVKVRPVTAIAAIPDYPPGREDSFSSGKA